ETAVDEDESMAILRDGRKALDQCGIDDGTLRRLKPRMCERRQRCESPFLVVESRNAERGKALDRGLAQALQRRRADLRKRSLSLLEIGNKGVLLFQH